MKNNRIVYKYQHLDKINQSDQRLQTENYITERVITARDPQYIPLLIKKYPTGQMTPRILDDQWGGVVKISAPKGLGLHLETTQPGKIIMVAGGTGLYPFSDIIDLLFKQSLLESNHELSQNIIQGDPILKQNPFKHYRFKMYAAFNQPEDIHPITLCQLSQLSKHPQKFSLVFRFKEREQEISNLYSHIQFTKNRFDKTVIEQAKKEQFSKIWICGPPAFNTQTTKQILASGFTNQHYLLI